MDEEINHFNYLNYKAELLQELNSDWPELDREIWVSSSVNYSICPSVFVVGFFVWHLPLSQETVNAGLAPPYELKSDVTEAPSVAVETTLPTGAGSASILGFVGATKFDEAKTTTSIAPALDFVESSGTSEAATSSSSITTSAASQ